MTATIEKALDWWAANAEDRVAIALGDDAVTFSELSAWSKRAAAMLADRGIGAGDRVALFGPNSLAWCAAAFAVIRTGAMLVPLNYRYTASELETVVADCSPSLILTDDARAERLERVAAGGVATLPMQGVEALRHGAAIDFQRDIDPLAPAVVAYTSGSTANPKGVVFTHANRMGYAFEAMLSDPNLRPGSRALAVAPLYTGGGTVLLIEFATLGITMFLEPDFNPERALDILLDEKIEIFFGVPTFFERIGTVPRFAQSDLSHLRLSATGGSRVSRRLLETWLERGVILRQLYGLTEAGGTTTVMDAEGALEHPEKCGRGGPFTWHKIVDSEGRECPRGTLGEILVRGPGVMSGYWNNPKATAETFLDGWLRSGDLGVIDSGGDLMIVDRLKDIIISGGLNISPIDIENVISQIEGVDEVAVIAAADERFGETPLAVVHATRLVTIPEVIAHCNQHLSDYKVPRYVSIEADPLPRLATGKISKRALKERFKDAASTLERVR